MGLRGKTFSRLQGCKNLRGGPQAFSIIQVRLSLDSWEKLFAKEKKRFHDESLLLLDAP